ncbi:hypothetical protein EDB84DRAFT_1485821 [Lactarius hengduanensis]|nr:hypothetical protein EDB84DRAFT_1485821 [Lactarius hengduanensis]
MAASLNKSMYPEALFLVTFLLNWSMATIDFGVGMLRNAAEMAEWINPRTTLTVEASSVPPCCHFCTADCASLELTRWTISRSASSERSLPVDSTSGESTAIASVFDEALRWDLADGPAICWEPCFPISTVTG